MYLLNAIYLSILEGFNWKHKSIENMSEKNLNIEGLFFS